MIWKRKCDIKHSDSVSEFNIKFKTGWQVKNSQRVTEGRQFVELDSVGNNGLPETDINSASLCLCVCCVVCLCLCFRTEWPWIVDIVIVHYRIVIWPLNDVLRTARNAHIKSPI